MNPTDLILLENCIWVLTKGTNVPAYDFDFSRFFDISRPWDRPEQLSVIGRFGAAKDYASHYTTLKADGISLINSPEMHDLCSELPHWYPLIKDMTPRSRWFAKPPSVDQIAAEFQWPVFVKGSRQTSRHRADLAIIEGPEQYDAKIEAIAKDPILGWQSLVFRDYLNLRDVEGGVTGKLPTRFEFRTFWWHGQLVGEGRYHTAARYTWTAQERSSALYLAQTAADRIAAPFIVIDLAQTIDGRWWIIELNDGQESGYVGVPPTALWQNIIDIEKAKTS